MHTINTIHKSNNITTINKTNIRTNIINGTTKISQTNKQMKERDKQIKRIGIRNKY